MTNVNEAIGVIQAARAAGMHVVISFTVETDGKLPTGQSLQEATQAVDAATHRAPAYYIHDQLRSSDPLRGGSEPPSVDGEVARHPRQCVYV